MHSEVGDLPCGRPWAEIQCSKAHCRKVRTIADGLPWCLAEIHAARLQARHEDRVTNRTCWTRRHYWASRSTMSNARLDRSETAGGKDCHE